MNDPKRRRRLLGASACLAVFALGGPSFASPADFRPCDGYEAPGRRADGITTGTWLFGLAATTSDFRRANVDPIGEAGIAACQSALADPALIDAFWLRRAHIIQALAFHQLSAEKPQDALASLTQSDAAGAGHDRFFADSIGLSNQFLRAIALYKLGKREEARVMLSAAAARRPFAASLQAMARVIRLTFDRDGTNYDEELRHAAPLEPDMVPALYYSAFLNTDFKAADGYADQISFEIPRGHGNWKIEGDDDRKYELIGDRARLAATHAYIRLALGDRAGSKTLLEQAKIDVLDATEPPVPPDPGGKVSKRARLDYDRRVSVGEVATREIDLIERGMKLRDTVAGKSLIEVVTTMKTAKPEDILLPTDLIALAKPANADETVFRTNLLNELAAQRDEARRKATVRSLADLVRLLPRPETEAILPRMQRQGIGIMRSDANGYGVKRSANSDLVTISFGSEKASRALAEEAAMLAAAQYAAREGKDSFLIDSARSIERTTTIVGLYASSGAIPSGYECRLSIFPANSAALPADLAADKWRLIRVADVIAALGGKFPSTEAAPAK